MKNNDPIIQNNAFSSNIYQSISPQISSNQQVLQHIPYNSSMEYNEDNQNQKADYYLQDNIKNEYQSQKNKQFNDLENVIEQLKRQNEQKEKEKNQIINKYEFELQKYRSNQQKNDLDFFGLQSQIQELEKKEIYYKNEVDKINQKLLLEEIQRENISPNSQLFKPQDHNIFGSDTSDRFQKKSNEGIWNPLEAKSEMVRPSDHQLFPNQNTQINDQFQRNPNKIGQSPFKNLSDLPAAGIKSKSPRNKFENNNDSQFIEKGGYSGNLQENIQMMIQDKQDLENELRKIEDMKRKSGADIRRKTDINKEIQYIDQQIQQSKIQLNK
ncbi:hypothetical protein IMG5_081350 [Ichthyophthirius multifiliis]|uniref:Uncharacterized protein n=1 Tax=Ichthyophthirius multifiliis TaxID=5932 RepID=G0QQM5_ICHMU|nr:hypothetical protein IMG5_081350 [Ichthyophthirius multifiliis]EGR32477.1 hypothetical protein IMG5_081350 [Ichthyophthirius multifiliis]|eukprot:XP_004036463.1 hypothetical protein IMG5_081350 [Ichthyophthirius multifiliis]